MKKLFFARVSALFSIKSIVTLVLTGVFAYQAITHQIDQQFMTVYTVVIAFYFGTQAQKNQNAANNVNNDKNNTDSDKNK